MDRRNQRTEPRLAQGPGPSRAQPPQQKAPASVRERLAARGANTTQLGTGGNLGFLIPEAGAEYLIRIAGQVREAGEFGTKCVPVDLVNVDLYSPGQPVQTYGDRQMLGLSFGLAPLENSRPGDVYLIAYHGKVETKTRNADGTARTVHSWDVDIVDAAPGGNSQTGEDIPF
jgi:hypothetical protein